MSLTQALNISVGAMGVHQNVISITSNNIANMNTEGYHKQKAHLGTMVLPLPIGESVSRQVKTSAGVELIKVQRYETSFIGSYYRDQLSDKAMLDKQADGLGDIGNLFDDLAGRGLDTALTDFYDALDNLNQYPTDLSARIHVLNAASTLTTSMNDIANNLNSLKTQDVGDGESEESLKNSNIYNSIQSMNATFDELASINKMLSQSQTGSLENNNLLDRRDLILNDLAKYGNFTTDIMPNGTVKLSMGGTTLVSGTKVYGKLDVQTAAQYDEYCQRAGIENTNTSNAVLMFRREDGSVLQNVNDRITSGEIGAMINDTTSENGINVNTILGSLDKLAQAIADVFNNLQTREGAFYLDNATGKIQLCNDNLEDYVWFVANDGSDTITAANISINSLLKEEGGYNKIAAAYFENYDPDDPDSVDLNAVGNADNIISMIRTKTDATSDEFSIIGNLPFAEFYNGLLGKVTSGLKGIQDAANIQNEVVEALNNKMASETSVDLNEELAELVRSQTAYSASARVFTTCNTLFDVLLNLGL